MGRVVDSHLHVWDPRVARYPWLEERSDLPRRATIPSMTQLTRADVGGLVFIEAGAAEQDQTREVRWLSSRAARSPVPARVVASGNPHRFNDWDAVTLASVDAVAGVRFVLPQDSVGIKDLRRSLEAAAHAGLVVDLLLMHHRELGSVIDALSDWTGRLVIDHLGAPPVSSGLRPRRDWARLMTTLSQHPGIALKATGSHLTTLAREPHWAEPVLHVLGAFVERISTGSDWPVTSSPSSQYADWTTTIRELDLDPEDCASFTWDLYRFPIT